jgi:hypothetical protein
MRDFDNINAISYEFNETCYMGVLDKTLHFTTEDKVFMDDMFRFRCDFYIVTSVTYSSSDRLDRPHINHVTLMMLE